MAKWWNIQNQGNKTAEIRLYGVICDNKWAEEDVTPTDFQRELDALGDIELLNVYINSPGGSVFAGFTIHNILKRHPAAVAAYVDGVAASIASVILQAADERIMASNSMLMIHNPQALVMGYSGDLRKVADDLDKITDPIVVSYAERTKVKAEKIRELMAAETWMTADEAVKMGFADKIDSNKRAQAKVDNKLVTINGVTFDPGNFRNFDSSKLIITNQAEPAAAPVTPVSYTEYDRALVAAQKALDNMAQTVVTSTKGV